MALKDDVVDYLRTKTAVTDIVGTATTQIRQGWSPQATPFPYITINILEYNHSHDLGGGAGFAEPEVEVHLWCRKEDHRNTLGEAIRGVLQGYSGTMGDTTVRGVMLPLDSSFDESPRDGSQGLVFHRVMTFQFSHVESIPTY